MKKNQGRIALSPARSAIERIKATGPPNVSVEKARQLLGPALFKLIREGWLDEDIIAALSDGQNENDLRRLLTEARHEEGRKRRERKKAEAAKKANHPTRGLQGSSGPVPPRSRVQGPGAAPMLAKPEPTLPSLPPPASPAQVERKATPVRDGPVALPPPGAPRPITRNPGIRRLD